MNNLLLFFALPIATIILAIVFQKIIRNPILTAAAAFAIYLIVTFATFDINFLVYAIAYTILAYIAAVFAEIIYRRCENENDAEDEENNTCCTNRIIDEIANSQAANLYTRNNRCYRR